MFRCKIGRMYLYCSSLILSGVNIKMNIVEELYWPPVVKTSANIYIYIVGTCGTM